MGHKAHRPPLDGFSAPAGSRRPTPFPGELGRERSPEGGSVRSSRWLCREEGPTFSLILSSPEIFSCQPPGGFSSNRVVGVCGTKGALGWRQRRARGEAGGLGGWGGCGKVAEPRGTTSNVKVAGAAESALLQFTIHRLRG